MLFPLSIAILPFVVNLILASPTNTHALQSRQTSSSSPVAGQAAIITKVTSDNGTDVTSSFQTQVYIPADEEIVSSNITDRALTQRTLSGPGVRAINHCRSLNAEFRMSMCDYHSGHHLSMQRYLVQCGLPNRRYNALNLRIITEAGACNRDEICVNGAHDDHGLPSIATCVSQRRFEPLPNYDTELGQERLHDYLTGRMAMAVMSQPDAETPMAVENMEMDAGIAGSSRVGGAVGLTSQKTCEDCVDLASDRLAEGTNFLNTEAKVVGSVSAGIAGILWLAVLSG